MVFSSSTAIPLRCRSLRPALYWSFGVICAPSLRCEDIAGAPKSPGEVNQAFGATSAQPLLPPIQPPFGFPTGPTLARLSPTTTPLSDKLSWDSSLSGTTPPPAPYLIPIQPLGIVSPISSDQPTDPNAPLPQYGVQLPDPVDANFANFAPTTGSVERPPENRAPSAGDFVNNLGGPIGMSKYQVAPGGVPSGFAQGPSSLTLDNGLATTLLDGLGMAISLSGTYDTNPSQGYSTTASGTGGSEGDFYLTLGGTIAYKSKASDWTYGALYTGGYNQYFSQTELSGYNQNAGASLNYEGGPLSAGLNLGVNFGSGANRYYGAVVNQVSVNYGLSARYRISPKTTLTGNFAQSLTSASGDNSSNTESFSSGISALWRYSSLTEFGPGISYSVNGGSTQQNLTSIGPTLTVNYKLSKKVSLNSLVGLEFSQYGDGQNADPTTSANIGLDYRASALWGMNLSFFRNVRADPGIAGQFQEITSLRLGYNRKIRRAQLNLGASLQNNVFQGPNSVTTSSPDSTYLSFDSSVGMPIFANSCNASLFLNYSDQNNGSAAQSWNSFRVGFSLSRSF